MSSLVAYAKRNCTKGRERALSSLGRGCFRHLYKRAGKGAVIFREGLFSSPSLIESCTGPPH